MTWKKLAAVLLTVTLPLWFLPAIVLATFYCIYSFIYEAFFGEAGSHD